MDNREKLNIPDDWGFVLSAQQEVGDQLLFLHYGYSDKTASPLEHMVSGGVVFENVFGEDEDAIGIGLSWSDLADFEPLTLTDISGSTIKVGGAENENQCAGEIFYRIQLTPRFTVTPNAQMLIKPAFNAEKNVIGLFGIRRRLAF